MLCAESVKVKPTRNDSGFITYSSTIYFYDIWLDSSGYLITQLLFFVLPHGSKIRERKK